MPLTQPAKNGLLFGGRWGWCLGMVLTPGLELWSDGGQAGIQGQRPLPLCYGSGKILEFAVSLIWNRACLMALP